MLVVKNSAAGIVVADRHGVVNLFSPAAERMFGYRAGEVLGQNVTMLMPQSMRSANAKKMAGYDPAVGGGIMLPGKSREFLARRKDGSEFPIDIAITGALVGGETMYSAIISDISERKQAEAAMRKAHAELAEALLKEKDLNEKQRQFVSLTSHELRTPLSIIDSTAHRLCTKRSDLAGGTAGARGQDTQSRRAHDPPDR